MTVKAHTICPRTTHRVRNRCKRNCNHTNHAKIDTLKTFDHDMFIILINETLATSSLPKCIATAKLAKIYLTTTLGINDASTTAKTQNIPSAHPSYESKLAGNVSH